MEEEEFGDFLVHIFIYLYVYIASICIEWFDNPFLRCTRMTRDARVKWRNTEGKARLKLTLALHI